MLVLLAVQLQVGGLDSKLQGLQLFSIKKRFLQLHPQQEQPWWQLALPLQVLHATVLFVATIGLQAKVNKE